MQNNTLAIALLVAVGLLLINIPFVTGEKTIATIITLVVAILLLLKKGK